MQTHEIRKRFLDHFVKACHTEVPSASVILDDPNLLFVNAGMVQFVPFFLGQRTPPYPTATSIQKCIRTPDIDEVGITTRHNTFFRWPAISASATISNAGPLNWPGHC